MTPSKASIAAYLTVTVLVLDVVVETLRLGVCVTTPPGPAAEACYARIGPVSQAFQKLRVFMEPVPLPVVPAPPPPPPVVVPKGGSTMEQLRKQPSL
jgi:hypothetical protein